MSKMWIHQREKGDLIIITGDKVFPIVNVYAQHWQSSHSLSKWLIMLCFEHSFLLPPSKARHYQISTANEGEKPKHEVHNVNQPSYTEVCTMELMETHICSALISKLVPISVYGSPPQLYNLQAIICVDVERLPPRDGMEMAPQGEGAKKSLVW